MKTFCEKLKSERLKKGLTQSQLAEKVGIGRSTVSYMEKDSREPNLETLRRILKVLNIDADYLLGVERDGLPDNAPDLVLTRHEKNIIRTYRRMESEKKVEVDRLMGIHNVDIIDSFMLKYSDFPKEVQEEIESRILERTLKEKRARWAAEAAQKENEQKKEPENPGSEN